MPHCRSAAAAAARQPPVSAKSRRPAGSSRPATAVPAPPLPSARDGSIFPCDPFSGTIAMWDHRSNLDIGIGLTRDCRLALQWSAAVATLYPLRPNGLLGGPVPTHSTTPLVETHD